MTDAQRHLLTSLFACVFFGYAAIDCLVFYRRTRRQALEYKNRPLEGFVRSPRYNWTIWITGTIGAIGFLISSWQLIINLAAMLRTN